MEFNDPNVFFSTASYEEADQFLKSENCRAYEVLSKRLISREMEQYKSTRFLDFWVHKEKDYELGWLHSYHLNYRRIKGDHGIFYTSIWGVKVSATDKVDCVALQYSDNNYICQEQYLYLHNGRFWLHPKNNMI
ncbi:hypothetical protein [Bacillus sp. 1P06AnD]|uniref:hypothetical protein n=1 Tax=Bacillus sp. 1P06AnD TaxID=3132208 RepID=UPI0039A14532